MFAVDPHSPPRAAVSHPDLDVGHRGGVGAAADRVLVVVEHRHRDARVPPHRVHEGRDGAVAHPLGEALRSRDP